MIKFEQIIQADCNLSAFICYFKPSFLIHQITYPGLGYQESVMRSKKKDQLEINLIYSLLHNMDNQLSLHLTQKNRKIKLPATGVLEFNKVLIKTLDISEAYIKIYFSLIENNQLQKSKSKRLSFQTYKTADQKDPVQILEFKDVQGKQAKIENPKGFNDTELEVVSDHPFDITIEITHKE